MKTCDQGVWMETSTAAKLLGVNIQAVRRLAETGLIRTRPIPGVRARLYRPDVEGLAKPLPTVRTQP